MCGIVGYLGQTPAAIPAVIDGLVLLQNRGYDSVGISIVSDNSLNTIKYASTTTNNAIHLLKYNIPKEAKSSVAIGHTRWATHGSKTDINAHPHHDNKNRISLIHNGIIENFQEIKTRLITKGYSFKSSTDTEVIAVLIGFYLDANQTVAEAIQSAIDELRGTWALLIIHRDFPDYLWAIRNGSPLLLGIESNCVMIASEPVAFHHYIQQYISLNDHDLFEIRLKDNNFTYNRNIHQYKYTKKSQETVALDPDPWPHWMLREIFEQPDSILRAINNGGRIKDDTEVKLGGLDEYRKQLSLTDHLILLGCGTSYHAGLWALSLFKSLKTFDTVALYDGADFSERDIPNRGKTAVVLISQSGETKDLHRCIQIIQENNIISIGVVNVIDSFIARETNCGIYLNAGREMAVASTKSFTNQCVVLSLLAVWFSQNKGTCLEKRRKIIKDIHNLPIHMDALFLQDNLDKIQEIANRIRDANSIFVLGKGAEEAVAKEGALKIKEVTYIHAEGYSSSALKHGPFGLLEPGLPVILLDISDEYRDKNENVYQEVMARESKVVRISDLPENIHADLWIGKNKSYGGILANVYLQLLSYYCAIEKGYNPDFPRNLAKVVSVE